MLALVLSILILPADTVTGHVVDTAGQPIPQAIVEVADLGTRVTTGADGGFRIALAPGSYTLTVRRTGFGPAVREISVGTGQPALAIVLTPSAFRLEDYSWSDEDGPSVETAFVRRVEVTRGPASVLYGSDAVGGVINVIPEELPDAAGGPGAVRTGFTLSGATNNIEIAPGVQVEGARGNLGWRV